MINWTQTGQEHVDDAGVPGCTRVHQGRFATRRRRTCWRLGCKQGLNNSRVSGVARRYQGCLARTEALVQPRPILL